MNPLDAPHALPLTGLRDYRTSILACVNPELDLLSPLRRYWGYEAFRPLQERIVKSLLGGRDTCVVMPTGGGEIALLSAAGRDAGGPNRDRRIATNRANAGSGRATHANGHSVCPAQ